MKRHVTCKGSSLGAIPSAAVFFLALEGAVLEGQGRDEKQATVNLTAIPYYAWMNREKGPMTVWIKEPAKP